MLGFGFSPLTTGGMEIAGNVLYLVLAAALLLTTLTASQAA